MTTINKQLAILEADLARKSPRTRLYHHSIAKKFLTESGDFSRSGMLKFLNTINYCDNSVRTAYYVLKRLCKALEIKFPLDEDDLPPPPDEQDIYTPTMSLENTHRIISYWKQFPGTYLTSLAFISTIFGLRAIEMTNVEVGASSIIVNVAKRRRRVIREHRIPEDMMKYLSGYEPMSEMTVKYAFWKICRRAGVKRRNGENWHSIRRRINTTCIDLGINRILVKRFLRWAKDKRDMADAYYHKEFTEINTEILKVHPFLRLWG